MQSKISRSVIKSIDIKSSFDKVYAYIVNPMNWPQWAIVNLRSIKPETNGWFKTITRFGEGKLKIHAQKELGIFDHTWEDSQASWTVPARVVRNNDGATVMLTLFQPSAMSDNEFDGVMKELDLEIKTLKEILEKN